MQRLPFIMICLLLFSFLSCRKVGGREQAVSLSDECQRCMERNRLDSAMMLNFRILDVIDTTSPENYDLIAEAYNNLGDVFYRAAIFERALQMYDLSLVYGSTLADKTEESRARRGLWRCGHVLDLPAMDTAIANSLRLLPHIRSEKEIASLYNNITGYYMYNGMYDSAFIYNRVAIEKSADSVTLYRNWSVRSGLFLIRHEYDSAWFYASLSSHSPDIYTKLTSVYRLSHIAEYEKRDTSLYLLKYYSALLDSIHNLKTSDSINAVLYRKQLSAVQDTMSRNRMAMTWTGIALVVVLCVLAVVFLRARRNNSMVRHEAEELKKKLSELNEYLVANNRKAEEYRHYSEQYRELVARQRFMEESFVSQLVNARDKCIDLFRRSSFYKRLPALIEAGDGILHVDKRKEMQDAINKDFLLLRHSLATYFDISDEEFVLYCLSAAGFSTKDCAACRGVSVSAIRMQRMRMNNKIKSFFSSDIDLSPILL